MTFTYKARAECPICSGTGCKAASVSSGNHFMWAFSSKAGHIVSAVKPEGEQAVLPSHAPHWAKETADTGCDLCSSLVPPLLTLIFVMTGALLGRLNLNTHTFTPDILILQKISRQWITVLWRACVRFRRKKFREIWVWRSMCFSCGQPYYSKITHKTPWRRQLKNHWIYQHNSNVSGIIFICLLVWGLFRSYLCVSFFCNHKN